MVGWFENICRTLSLTIAQASIHLGTTLLDSNGWALDTVEDPTHQGRALMGLADEACNPCGVCVIPCTQTLLADHPTAYLALPCGSHSPFRTLEACKASTATLRRLDGKSIVLTAVDRSFVFHVLKYTWIYACARRGRCTPCSRQQQHHRTPANSLQVHPIASRLPTGAHRNSSSRCFQIEASPAI